MCDEALPPPQFSIIAGAQALHLLCQGIRGDVVPLAGADQRRRGLGLLEEIPLV
jgi:hypothetical protein